MGIMEDLNKTQIVLLCLLVSFVTSIGTGIISFSLLSEVPQAVTQTINRVVERTIEKVVPARVSDKTITKETTVVVKEEDLIIDAIGKISQSIVQIKAGSEETFYGLGLIVSKEGLIVADKKLFNSNVLYKATLADGSIFSLSSTPPKNSSSVVFFNLVKTKQDTTVFTFAVFGDSDKLQLGQSVIAIAGVNSPSVATGRISMLEKNADKTTLSLIKTDVVIKDTASGGPILNLSGEVVGLNTANITDIQSGNFTPINLIKTEMK
ncbi:hypothetical protein EXS61_01975 [Candidatus Parcubacteria bacterium]|nr:hypothetical protein [Candidatus Parcubacteria bacterium]